MDLYVGESFVKTFDLDDVDIAGWTTPKAYWLFAFCNGDKYALEAASFDMNEDHIESSVARFNLPADELTRERAGPGTYQLGVKDAADDSPVTYNDQPFEFFLHNPKVRMP